MSAKTKLVNDSVALIADTTFIETLRGEITMSKTEVKKPVVTNLTPIKLENVSIEELCMMELLSEASERAEREGHNRITLTSDRLKEKIAEKLREKKETGKVSTFLS